MVPRAGVLPACLSRPALPPRQRSPAPTGALRAAGPRVVVAHPAGASRGARWTWPDTHRGPPL